MILKRYQYYGPNGISWTKWFPYKGDVLELKRTEKWQLKNKLLNQYKEE